MWIANFLDLPLKSAYFLILCAEFPTYGQNRPIFLTTKTQKNEEKSKKKKRRS